MIYLLDFTLSPCSEYCIPSFGWFPGVWILYADVSKHSVCSIFIGGVSNKIKRGHLFKYSSSLVPVIIPAYTTYEDRTEWSETSAHKIQTPGNRPKERMLHDIPFLPLSPSLVFPDTHLLTSVCPFYSYSTLQLPQDTTSFPFPYCLHLFVNLCNNL
jgi:hypothetical protein